MIRYERTYGEASGAVRRGMTASSGHKRMGRLELRPRGAG
jgi:hypothetical protein